MVVSFLQLFVSMLIDTIGEAIDSGFTNSIGLNEICIFGIICSIHGVCYTLSCYGTYVYRITGEYVKENLVLTAIIGVGLCCILVVFAPYFKYIWYVAPELELLLKQCIMCAGLCEIPRSLSIFLLNYMQYTSQNKLSIRLLVIFYALMFIFDIIAVFYFSDLRLVILGTGLSNIIFDVLAYYKSGVYKHSFCFKNIFLVLKIGLGYFIERIFGRLSIAIVDIGATRLGTLEYSVYVVVNKALHTAMTVINTLQVFFVSRLRINSSKCDYSSVDIIWKEIRYVCFALFAVLGSVGLVVVRCSIDFSLLIAPFLVSMISYFSGVFYIKWYSVFSIRNNKAEFIKAGVYRLIVTFILVGVAYLLTDISLYVYCLYYFTVYLSVGIYMKFCMRKEFCNV